MKTELAPSRTAGTVRSSQGIPKPHGSAMIREDFTVFTPSVSVQASAFRSMAGVISGNDAGVPVALSLVWFVWE